MSARRMKWEIVDKVLLLVHGDGIANDAEWSAFLDEYDKHASLLHSLVLFLPTTGPDSAQRRRLSDIHLRRPTPIAVLSSSQLARGAVTALSWLGVAVKAFEADHVDAALTHLALSPRTRDLVLKQLATLRRDLADADRGMTG
jgi:hypothetical protein